MPMCALIRVLAKQKLAALETQVIICSMMLVVAVSFSENGDGTWLEMDTPRKFDKSTYILAVWTEPMRRV